MRPTRFTNRRGMRLAADVHGPDDGPGVMLLHGGGQTRHAWDQASLQLGRHGYNVVNLDLRGHGESDWAPDGDYGLSALVDDLEDVTSQLGRPVSLVGASLGGMCSLTAAGEGRVRVERLVLVDVVPQVEPAGADRIRNFMLAHPDGFGSLSEAADAVAGYIPERPRPKSTAGLEKNLRRREDGRWYWHWDPALLSGTGARSGERMTEAAAAIQAPTLVVRGVLSDVVTPAGVEALRKQIPHLAVRDVGGAGHMVAGDRNDAFIDAVAEFLAPVRAG